MHAMKTGFDFVPRTQIAYGVNRVQLIAQDVRELSGGRKVVLVTDPGVVSAGIADVVSQELQQGGIEVRLFSNVKSDPTSASIDEAADCIRSFGAKCVIGLGGGSAMDVSKMSALVAEDDKPAEHYALMANPFRSRTIRLIAIPTTSGTGAEVTSTVVFTNSAGRKVWGWDRQLAPDLAILEPGFTVKLPKHLTAATTLDALVHAIEACTGKDANPFVRAVGLQAIRLVAANLERVIQNPEDLEGRGHLAMAATLAGMAIENAGTGIAHSIGHALGTIGGIHHGRAVALALDAAYTWNVEAAVAAHVEVAQAMGISAEGKTEMELALAGGEKFSRMIDASGLKRSLREDGLSLADLNRLVETTLSKENEPMLNRNCRTAAREDLRRISEYILEAK